MRGEKPEGNATALISGSRQGALDSQLFVSFNSRLATFHRSPQSDLKLLAIAVSQYMCGQRIVEIEIMLRQDKQDILIIQRFTLVQTEQHVTVADTGRRGRAARLHLHHV